MIRLPNESTQYMQLHQTSASLFYSGFRYEYYRILVLKGEITALKTVQNVVEILKISRDIVVLAVLSG